MNVRLIWDVFYPQFTDDEIRSAHLYADFVCWCQAARLTKKQARLIVVRAAVDAGLSLPEDFSTTFTSLISLITSAPDLGEECLREDPNASVQHRAKIFISAMERFYSGEYANSPASAAAGVLRDVFSPVPDEESLFRIIDTGERKYNSVAGVIVMHGDEFYSIDELRERLGPEQLDEFLRECNCSQDSDTAFLGEDVIRWRFRENTVWFADRDDEESESDQDPTDDSA